MVEVEKEISSLLSQILLKLRNALECRSRARIFHSCWIVEVEKETSSFLSQMLLKLRNDLIVPTIRFNQPQNYFP